MLGAMPHMVYFVGIGFHNKVERVFLVKHIGFVGVYSGKVHRGFSGTNGGFFGTFGRVFWYLPGVLLVQNGGFFGRHHTRSDQE